MRKLKDLYHHYLFARAYRYCLPGGQKRIYFHHVMKTGGTSMNHMFFVAAALGAFVTFGARAENAEDEREKSHHQIIQVSAIDKLRRLLPSTDARDPGRILDDLWGAHRHRLAVGDLVFQTGDKRRIEQGNYFYATSHFTQHELRLPDDTFTFTLMRDPVERVLSYYRMLQSQRARGERIARNEHILGAGFDDFLNRIPRQKLLAQLYHFSPGFDPGEAFERIVRCDCWFFLNDLGQGVRELSAGVGLALRPIWSNRSEVRPLITRSQMDRLRELMEPELRLHARLHALRRGAADPRQPAWGPSTARQARFST